MGKDTWTNAECRQGAVAVAGDGGEGFQSGLFLPTTPLAERSSETAHATHCLGNVD